jgi:hypothetical protein
MAHLHPGGFMPLPDQPTLTPEDARALAQALLDEQAARAAAAKAITTVISTAQSGTVTNQIDVITTE